MTARTTRPGFVLSLLVSLVASSACDVTLRGVPIIDRRPDSDAGPDDTQAEGDGSLAEDADGGPADEGEGEGEGADVDADVEDSGDEDGGDLLSYRYDFPETNAALEGAWKAAAAGVAEIWDGRLCMHSGGSAELKLAPGQYGYIRVDVPTERSFSLHALAHDGELFALQWQSDATEGGGYPDVALGEVSVNNQYPFAVTSYEIALDFVERTVRARPRGGEWQSAPFARLVEGNKLLSLVFQHDQAEPGYGDDVVCFDNVYVAAGPPEDGDPFAAAPRVNACVPGTSDVHSRCISEHCCSELAQVFRDACWESCPSGECPCTFPDAAECAATCVRTHPSRSVSDCSDLCRLQLDSWSLFTCVDQYCAGEASEPVIVELSPASEPAPASAHSKRLKIEYDPLATPGEPTWLEFVELDLRSHVREELADLTVLTGEAVVLYAEPSHARAIAFVFRAQGGLGRLFLWNAETSDGEFAEVRLNEPVQSVEPSATREYAWVSTQSARTGLRHLYLLQNDAVVFHQLIDENLELGFGPDDRYAFVRSGDAVTTLDLRAGVTETFTLGSPDVEWQAALPFDDSIAWLARPSEQPPTFSWLSLAGLPILGSLPPAPARIPHHLPQDAPFLTDAAGLYWRGPNAPLKIAALPTAYDAESWVGLSASKGRALYYTFDGELTPGVVPGHGLTMTDAATGSVLATLGPVLPTAPEGSEVTAILHSVVAFDADHGIFATDQLVGSLSEGAEGIMLLDAYAFDGTTLTTRRLSTRSFVTWDRYPILSRTDSSIYVIEREDPTQPLIYDVRQQDFLTYYIDEYDLPGSVWAQYPRRPPHHAP
jgi:hypothetical protein